MLAKTFPLLLLCACASTTQLPAAVQPEQAGNPKPSIPAASRFGGTSWHATELAGKPTPKQQPNHEAYLQFESGGRVSGSDGCNRLIGTYQLDGERVAFAQMASTQMACLNSSGTEGPFRDALKNATRLTLTRDRMELFDATGTRLAVFSSESPAGVTPSPTLAGTSWQLVEFQSGDDTTLMPGDRAKYTVEFETSGQLFARIDCNRGRGTWKSSGPSQIEFGPLALTRAKCHEGSLHDQIVRQWPYIRSYVMKNGHLFLALMVDGGIYEFEPIQNAKP